MPRNIFRDCKTPEEIRKLYRKMAMKHHPDHGGNTADMQELNRQYEQALQGKSGETFTNNDRQEYTYTYSQAAERATMEKLYNLLALKMANVQIELIGTWIWVSGNTRAYKDLLGKNGLGLRFSGKRKMWYYTTTHKRGGRYGRKSMDELRDKYGARTFQTA